MLLNFDYHFFNHLFHFLDFRRNLDNIMLHFRMLENALGAEHGSVVLAVELNFLSRMNITVPY